MIWGKKGRYKDQIDEVLAIESDEEFLTVLTLIDELAFFLRNCPGQYEKSSIMLEVYKKAC